MMLDLIGWGRRHSGRRLAWGQTWLLKLVWTVIGVGALTLFWGTPTLATADNWVMNQPSLLTQSDQFAGPSTGQSVD